VGVGHHCLTGYAQSNPIVAGVALMTHPSEWPTLCDDYPVVRYLQHSQWAGDVYRPYFGGRVSLWAVGIDTATWAPRMQTKTADFLIYDKIRWDRETTGDILLSRVREELGRRRLTWTELRYGSYDERDFRARLDSSRAMIFLCEHESQGLAYQECLSSGVPILAWDQGRCLDPNRFHWGQPDIPASSVPFFDDRCGRRFQGPNDFATALDDFQERLRSGTYSPRTFVLDQLTLEKCSAAYLDILNNATQ
jgi:glycosyltransferase involved in cell wall biosynthesis